MEHSTLKIEGMTCMGCVRTLTSVLSALPGVSHVTIDLESGIAKVDHNATLTSPDALSHAIEGAGFELI
ncbi:heavy-metal-associated domain-containing protein [Iodobacter ciconiae]|uniref:Heavy-metal-associated domain-containing protein n=1 Tax=Iodobacter ciconiae TaxID=2496266 RepID=A0A3S8ZPA1_9NEIS|nr:heavy metal-associated domain-containing protein [Iodobacter ciconiae]AZN35292.1 heavy-metal-associated domain-containing protein [Iodobacter ciconiae]